MTIAVSSADFETAAQRLKASANALGVTTAPPDADGVAKMVKDGAISVLAEPDGCLLTYFDKADQCWYVTHVTGSRQAPTVWTALFVGILTEWIKRGQLLAKVRSTKNSAVAAFAAQIAGGVDAGDHYEFTVQTAATKLGVSLPVVKP